MQNDIYTYRSITAPRARKGNATILRPLDLQIPGNNTPIPHWISPHVSNMWRAIEPFLFNRPPLGHGLRNMLLHIIGRHQVIRARVNITPLNLRITARGGVGSDQGVIEQRLPRERKLILPASGGDLPHNPADQNRHPERTKTQLPQHKGRLGKRIRKSLHGARGRRPPRCTIYDQGRDGHHLAAGHMAIAEQQMRGGEDAAVGEDVHHDGPVCSADGFDGGHQAPSMRGPREIQIEIGGRAQQEDDARRGRQFRVLRDKFDQRAGGGAEPESDHDRRPMMGFPVDVVDGFC